MRVANYYRVSTKLQEKKFSLAAQKEELTKYAAQQGWILIDEFKDVETGGKLDKKGLNNLLDLVEDGGVDVVLVVDQDRLSRLDTVAWEYLKSTLRDNGVKIAEPGNIIDLENEDDEFISDIKNLIAKREKKAIVRRMMRGKRQRVREGKGWGKPPFEYRYNKISTLYEAIEEWKWVIPLIDKLYLEEQLGMTLIADRLNEISKTPTGRNWNEHLISVRLHTKAYHGVMEKEFSNGETITVDNIYEPMRTEETYNRIQEELKKRRGQFSVAGRKNANNVHMLKRTNLSCGICGRKIHVASHGYRNNPLYYLKHGRKARLNGEVCDIAINTIRIDNNIIKALKDILTSEELAKRYINIEHDEKEVTSLKTKIKNLEKTLTAQNAAMDRLLDLYISGGLKKDKFQEKEREINSKITVQEEELEKLKRKHAAIDSSTFTYKNLYQYMLIARKIDTKLTPLERAQLMGELFPNGVLYEDKLVLVSEVFNGIPVEFNIPIAPDPFPEHHSKKNKDKG